MRQQVLRLADRLHLEGVHCLVQMGVVEGRYPGSEEALEQGRAVPLADLPHLEELRCLDHWEAHLKLSQEEDWKPRERAQDQVAEQARRQAPTQVAQMGPQVVDPPECQRLVLQYRLPC